MDALTYWKKHGDDHCKRISEQAGTTLENFKVCMYWKQGASRNRFGAALALRLVAASDNEMTFDELRPDILGKATSVA